MPCIMLGTCYFLRDSHVCQSHCLCVAAAWMLMEEFLDQTVTVNASSNCHLMYLFASACLQYVNVPVLCISELDRAMSVGLMELLHGQHDVLGSSTFIWDCGLSTESTFGSHSLKTRQIISFLQDKRDATQKLVNLRSEKLLLHFVMVQAVAQLHPLVSFQLLRS